MNRFIYLSFLSYFGDAEEEALISCFPSIILLFSSIYKGSRCKKKKKHVTLFVCLKWLTRDTYNNC